jgi:hypothetical protein
MILNSNLKILRGIGLDLKILNIGLRKPEKGKYIMLGWQMFLEKSQTTEKKIATSKKPRNPCFCF